MNANVIKKNTVLKLSTGHNGKKQTLLQSSLLPRGREVSNPLGAHQTLKAPGERGSLYSQNGLPECKGIVPVILASFKLATITFL